MNKKISLIYLSFLLFISLSAQEQRFEIGFSAGYTRNSLTTDNGNRSFTRNGAVNGFQVGVPIQYHIYDWLGVQIDLSYMQKNYIILRTGFLDGITTRFANSFVQAPVMAHFSFGGDNVRGFLNVGGFAGYWASSKIRGVNASIFSTELHEFEERVPFNSEKDRRLELGLLAGTGLEYRIAPRYKIFAEARYHYSLTDLQKDYMINQIPRYNNTVGVQLGVFYGFGGR